jgi:ribonucleotide monophosphatase NagD (HAD superfamily)/choline kinase
MKLVILNAGIGSRLENITKNKPKCLLNLIKGYKTLLENQLMIFNKFEILLIIGYKSEMIIDVIKNYKNVSYVINEEYNTTNNMYSINLAKNFIGNDPFFVLNGDIYIEEQILNDIKSMDLNFNSVFVQKHKFNDENMKVNVVDSFIIDIDKKLKVGESMGLSMDFYYIKDTQVYFREIEEYLINEKNHWAELILKKMMKNNKFKPVYSNVFWYEIDTIDDYINYINKKNTFKNYDNYFLDIDGNLLLNSKLINGADLFLKRIKNFKLITNNSSKTKEIYQNIFNKYDININKNDIINSVDSTLIYLNNKKIKNIYLFSTQEVKKIFENNKFNIFDLKNKENIDLVVITYNTEYTYTDLINLFTIIKEKDYIVTHIDQMCPYENFYIPDVGCLIDNIYSCLGKKPLDILGKPNLDFSFKGSSIIIGDNLETDYQQSINSKTDFCLTLTGRTKIEDLEQNISNLKKINVVKSINDFKIN